MRFKEGRISVLKIMNDLVDPSSSQTNENVDRVREIIRNNRRLTIREMSEEVEISYGSCQYKLTNDLAMRRISVKFVPRILTDEQKPNRIAISQELFERVQNDVEFLKNITGDETYGFTDVMLKQSVNHHSENQQILQD